ncbi:MAG: hypothetical protein IBJ07_12505 [Rhizobiaceae bacterium]|nr:hypothetical protein [Rhizobiaceae bacterium]
MPLQNRADPSGALHAVAARGLFTGNRGILHDPETKRLAGRRWTTRAWIVCTCTWKGRHRDVWGHNGRGGGAGWTELFFADEVTALAAGHRPCFTCRRDAARAFQSAFAAGNDLPSVTAPQMDERLHAERRLSSRSAPLPVSPDDLPDAAMIEAAGQPLVRREGTWLRWTFDGYVKTARPTAPAFAITPPSTIAALGAGYRPVWGYAEV